LEALRKIPPPNISADECLRRPNIHPHFVDADSDFAAKWLPFLDFDGFAGIHRDRRGQSFARARWRCVAPSVDGARRPCGATFVTEGAFLDPKTALPKPRRAMGMRMISDVGSTAIAAHFAEQHQLEHAVVGRWSTDLTECCEDPKVACAYVACPYAFNTGMSQVRFQGPDTVTCTGECVAGYVIASPLLIFAETIIFVVSVVTACGFPCDSESVPPMSFKESYENRRALVGALGVDESAMRTRCTTVFCLPCSECQMFREQRNSGVWPGLLCCTASDRDRAIMAPSAVRARYTVDGYYGVRPRAGAAPHAQEAAAMMRRDRDLGPLVGWRME
jgi:Cys-rich protein (TIGR01571 family)